MVTLPSGFVATRFPGYFWHVGERKLYSLKISGILKPLKRATPNRWNHYVEGYRISDGGWRRTLTLNYLMKLQYKDSEIPAVRRLPY